jgi:hypothetical protein
MWYYAYDVQKAYVPSQATVMILPKCHLSVKRSQGFFIAPDIFDELLPLEMGSHFPGRAFSAKELCTSWEIDRQLFGGRLDLT